MLFKVCTIVGLYCKIEYKVHYCCVCVCVYAASYVMTYHTIMTNSSSFIAGLKSARSLADTLTQTTGVTIFPYSVFYVYYEQYLTTVHDFLLNIGLSLGT